MKHKQWMLNKEYGGDWEATEFFETKEEAITHGIILLRKYNNNTQDKTTQNNLIDTMGISLVDNEQVYTFYVGQIEEVKLPDKTDILLENIAESVYEVAGEYSEGYLGDVTDEDKKELQNFIYRWAKQRSYLPDCFLIRETEEIDIRMFEEVAE
ncbi:TPA: hypothetical protein LEQ12_002524 [Listeria monocytogenes]|uniref:hypothetical protein n=1 Tax=Listeria TaxID=1637 RepID=UPI000A1E22DC|nr:MULTISPECIES: hypothetical protein [Listeria]EAE6190775.1 hypothetical protein [Listeria monocytogenes]EAK8992437.1 hypothetical protein [Listeria monocytogenes]EAK8995626.1 hypothetical protein [Listeria monocytogenes]EBF5351335.1 hypothetical protein [Listeria monocytogenes]EBF6148481.1 hypothetical protein [Listeria monocytogenes]